MRTFMQLAPTLAVKTSASLPLRALVQSLKWVALMLGLVTCSAEPVPARGQLMVVLQTDMSLPKDISRVRLQVSSEGTLRHDETYVIKPDGRIALPATLAVVAGEKKNPVVDVRVIGFRRNEARIFAKVVTTIPSERTALLHIPVQWLCDDSVIAVDADTFESNCEPEDSEERACRAGRCEKVELPEAELPDYTPDDVFGGSEDPEDSLGLCFATETCFDQGFDVQPDEDCRVTVAIPNERELNLGLQLPQGGDGICSDNGCYVPLDRSELLGWSEVQTQSAGPAQLTAQLPPAVCDKLSVGTIAGVRATTSCQTKTPRYPTCGPWSVIETPAQVEPPIDLPLPPADAGADAGIVAPTAEAGAPPGAGDASTGADAAPDAADAAAVVEAISIEASATSAPAGESVALTATALLSDGSTTDVTAQVEWLSSDEAVAIVTAGELEALTLGQVQISARLGEVTSAAVNFEVTAPELLDLTIRRSTQAVGPGEVQLQAIGTYTDGSEVDLTTQASWVSSNSAIVSVDATTGLARAEGPGSAEVTATLGEISDSIPFNVEEQGATPDASDAGAP